MKPGRWEMHLAAFLRFGPRVHGSVHGIGKETDSLYDGGNSAPLLVESRADVAKSVCPPTLRLARGFPHCFGRQVAIT